jgi:hypothetical protein
MKDFANDDSDRNFESTVTSAHDSAVKTTGISDAERPRETNASGDRADGAGCHAADVRNPSEAARQTARRLVRKEIGRDWPEEITSEITVEMIDEATRILSETYGHVPDWFTCEMAVEVYVAMRSLAYSVPSLERPS